MKQLLAITTIISALSFLSIPTAQAQVFVSIKPVAPKKITVRPIKARQGYVWVDGHWKWSARKNSYTWADGHWMRAKQGYTYKPGHWVSVPKGHKWVPGHWARV